MTTSETTMTDTLAAEIRDEIMREPGQHFDGWPRAAEEALEAAVRVAVRRETARRPRVHVDEFAQDEPAPGEEWVGNLQRVEARTATGNRLYGTGVVVAYTDRPTVTIRRDDGTRFHWIADLCRPARGETGAAS